MQPFRKTKEELAGGRDRSQLSDGESIPVSAAERELAVPEVGGGKENGCGGSHPP